MLRISKKGDYGVFMLAHIARSPGKLTSTRELAELSGVHRSVAANILKALARAGILESVRGLHGGYRLARPAGTIALREILEVVERAPPLVDCADPAGSLCSLTQRCPSHRPMRVVHHRIRRILEETKLSDLAPPEEEGCGCPGGSLWSGEEAVAERAGSV